MATFDVVVVGGGPAGMTLSTKLASAGLNVGMVLKAPSSNMGWQTLSPDCKAELEKLGVWDLVEMQSTPLYELSSLWGRSALSTIDYGMHPYGPWRCIYRPLLDSAILKIAEAAGVKVLVGSCYHVANNNDKWNCSIKSGGAKYNITARFIVDATGRSSRVARLLGHEKVRYDRLISLVSLWRTDNDGFSFMSLLEAVEDGWIYFCRCRKDLFMVCYSTDADMLQRTASLENTLCSYLRKGSLIRPEMLGELIVLSTLPANISKLKQSVGHRWLAIGDAESTYDPISSQGIAHALLSAEVAANVIANYLSTSRHSLSYYAEFTRDAFSEHLSYWSQHYQNEWRWPHREFWKRRQCLAAGR